MSQRRTMLRMTGYYLRAWNIVTLKTFGRWMRSHEPGSAMLFIARMFFTERKIAREFMQIIGDYREEYQAAKAEGRWKMFVVQVEHWHGFLKACGLDKYLDLAVLLSSLIAKILGQ